MDDDQTASEPQPAPSGAPATAPSEGSAIRPRPGQAGSASVCISDPARRAADDQWLRSRALAAVRHLGVPGEVRVRIVNDAEMAAAHERYSKVAGTTDVLTFDLSEDAEVLDVDILVCADEAGRQARARGHTVGQELLLYIVHGVLHCLGHDDHSEEDAAAMHAREDEVLRAIGVGTTFAVQAGGEGG